MTFKEILFYKENGKYYLHALFDCEHNGDIFELSVPKIELPIVNCQMNITTCYNPFSERPSATIDLGFGELNVLPVDGEGTICTMLNITERSSNYVRK